MTTVNTPLGPVQGTALDGCERYAGIRYAQAPVGPRRFLPPEPVEPWTEVYDATEFGASAPQPPPIPGFIITSPELRTSEDCLFLNVFTPTADDGRRPVMVWIHGGAYTIGSGDLYDGSSFARNGDVVVVTLNYRLGVLGWVPLDHLDPALAGSGNNGVRDQIQALRWVRDNIAAFGGDPGNVTIFGESAGGGSVAALLAAPDADGLYHRAIIQSGAPNILPAWKPENYVQQILDHLEQPEGGIEALRAADANRLIEAQIDSGAFDRMGRDRDHAIDGSGMGPRPSVDGVVLTATPVEAVRRKGAQNVPLIIGTNADEGTLFSLLLPTDVNDDDLAEGLRHVVRDPEALFEVYRGRHSPHRLIVEVMTDAVFRIPSLRLADAYVAAGAPVWVYLFTWDTPVFGGLLGATHALELPFVWDLYREPGWQLFVGANPPESIATAMQHAWLAFARTADPAVEGLPAWPVYHTTARPTFEIDEELRVVDDPDQEVREAWYKQTDGAAY